MQYSFIFNDYEDVVDLAKSDTAARGTTVYWFGHPSTYGKGHIHVIVDNDKQADVYFDISIALFGHPNTFDISEDYSHLGEATSYTII